MYCEMLQSLNRLCGGRNRLAETLQSFNRQCSSHNWLADLLQVGSKQVVKTGTTPYRLSTILPVVKICLGNICRASTSFAVLKTGLLNNYMPSSSFGVVKLVCWPPSTGFFSIWNVFLNFYSPSSFVGKLRYCIYTSFQLALQWSKCTHSTSTSFIQTLWYSNHVAQPSISIQQPSH